MSIVSPRGAEAGPSEDHTRATLASSRHRMTLQQAAAAYAADADHLARYLLIGLLLDGAVTQDEVNAAVASGLAGYRGAMRTLRGPGGA